ncbi:HAMP domain-containing protein [Stackebrandtia nassauensis]|uniref:Circadian input-output histidine kinase CikA n=1 Tax=Stackebrandtia nassauensis (strain DSM 44728 / CIP 108903 / NRRL B-16338 / NBRC 102104 / LLR-40K-21) TaxID=446470 RepID=D3QA51_STANL|nr:HAMP domain-containing protein [Stackebrandtia nassauensis]ADD40763.1 GAF sensor hybrid histidine kinase [Stackebrandtia nassauensis DSM 44728]
MTSTRAVSDHDFLEILAEALGRMEIGDFTVRLPRGDGLAGEVADRFNAVAERSDRRTRELQLISRVVGREGRLTERLDAERLDGSWREGAEAVNRLVDDVVRPTSEIARVLNAVAAGDLKQRAQLEIEGRPLRGEFRSIAETVNTMVELLAAFADEVTRVAREVGTDGKLGGQAQVEGVSGRWRQLTDSVNTMASNLTNQVRSIASVTTAIAAGDLSQTVDVDAKGEVAELAETVNSLTNTLQVFAGEVTRVAREVGTDGKLGGQADVPGVAGTWKDLTDNVNGMAFNLTEQVRGISTVATAVASGDLTQKITVTAQGEILELKNTVNTMVDQLSSFADEVTRVAREVGTEGRLGGQAQVYGVAGTWRQLTENVNQLARNLTDQVRGIATVTKAVQAGDLSQKITVDAQGEVAALKDTINTMVDQLSRFADEVNRVAREVGTQGRLGGQANVRGVSGVWKDLTDNVNLMAFNLTEQVRNISTVATAVQAGDLSQKITVDASGEMLELKQVLNTMVEQLSRFADEVTRVAREVGTDGKLAGQANVRDISGVWKELTDNVNQMASNLTEQVRNIATVATAVQAGDLSQKITVDAQGEMLQLKTTVNTMVDQLSSFADEVTRVAREVGTEGRLGGQARVRGVSGIWKELTDNVNQMASNLTEQVRNIATVTKAVADGDLTQKITVDAEGEILDVKTTVNTMVDQLSSFADEVTRVAREVGSEGKLGGQAQVDDVSGTWRALTNNVNSLAATLTNQLRSIASVAESVARGDLTQSVDVEAAGEVAELRESINEMIVALRETTAKNADQDWLNSNLARVSGLLQGQRDLTEVCRMIMTEVTPLVDAQTGTFFTKEMRDDGIERFVLKGYYGYIPPEREVVYAPGEGLVGQAAASRRPIRISDIPDGYLTIRSGLGEATPVDLVIMPVQFEGQQLGVMEFASFRPFSPLHVSFLESLVANIGTALNNIVANGRTEVLLTESRRLTTELTQQSNELQRANDELEEQARQLENRNREIEIKNRDVENARLGLEEKAEQLAQASRYKSQFLANISHELRTPLNSLLLLARLLAENTEQNLSPKQIDFARTIHSAGSDLLTLIDDILDLSKIEAGRMDVDPHEVSFTELCGRAEATFRPQAEDKNLQFSVELEDGLPDVFVTDSQKLQQVLRNFLSNAVKFTDSGSVTLKVGRTDPSYSFGISSLDGSDASYYFTVADTGIGISDDKMQMIFEPFQQADGGTSRKYGGTGLGLSISKSYADLLGGAIVVDTSPGRGSTFTLYVPDALNPKEPSLPTYTPLPSEHTDTDSSAYPEGPILSSDSIKDDGPVRALDGSTVLIVDDDVRNVFALTAALEMHGISVVYAENGADGIAKLTEREDIDIVLMDAMMPDMDGNETTVAIRRIPRFADLPIIFLTARAMQNDRDASLEAGASSYITKPVDLDELLGLMAYWVTGGDNAEDNDGGGQE